MALNPTLPEILWTMIGVIGLTISIRVYYHSHRNRRALRQMGLNGPRSLIVSRDIFKATLYIIGNLGVIGSGVAAIILFPQAPSTPLFQIARLLFPWFLIIIGVMLCLLPINDEVAQQKFMALMNKEHDK